jgi:Ca2+/Na+ antiporter
MEKELADSDNPIVAKPDEQFNFHYPQFHKRRKAAQFFKKLLNFTIWLSMIFCLFIDLTDNKPGISWSLYTTTSCLYVLYLIYLYSNKKKKIKKITYSAYASIILNLLLGLYTDSPFWAIDFILPLGIFTTNLCLTYYFVVRKRKALHDVAIYNLVASLLGLIPLLLFLLDQLTYTWPSITCGLYSLLILSGLMFFSTSQTKEELKRRFHI